MATELVIKSWCDRCLNDGTNTPGETVTVPALFGEPAFDIEVCDRHALSLKTSIAELRPFGRGVGKGVPKTPGRGRAPVSEAQLERQRAAYTQPAPGACPECGHPSPSIGALRVHLRQSHEKSLADVGLAESRHKCGECGSGFPNRQGLAAHFRISHPGIARTEQAS